MTPPIVHSVASCVHVLHCLSWSCLALSCPVPQPPCLKSSPLLQTKVTQWLYPSKNGKVLKIGMKVKVLKPFEAFRTETSGEDALGIFPQKLPVGLHGTVVFCHCIGNAPTSGNCLIAYDLPEDYQETDTTGGAGQTLGALLTMHTDFKHLEVVE